MSAVSRYVQALWGMARPSQIVSIYMVFVLGLLMAAAFGFTWKLGAVLIAIPIVLFASLAVHYANEYADVETDALANRTAYSGGSGVLPSGLVPRQTALIAAWVALVIACALQGLALALGLHAIEALLIMALIVILGWSYSLPPLKLAWRGWGELDNAVLGAIAMPMYGYSLLANQIDWLPIVLLLPVFLIDFANLLATTWPDREPDRAVGKYTLATQWPVERLRILYRAAVITGYGSLISLAILGWLPWIVAGLAALALPLSVWGIRTYTRQESAAPSVWAMVVIITGYMLAWGGLSLSV
ncbi:MAG: prenyltransferase [Chloroflexi bacterium]|nr:prenyltransferase [Chloroflexota bacterium]